MEVLYFILFANPKFRCLNDLGGHERGLERFLKSCNPLGILEQEERKALISAPPEFLQLIKEARQDIEGSRS